MKSIPTLQFVLLVSCTRQSESISEHSDTNVTTGSIDNFAFIIKDGQIGNLKTGEKITEVFEKLKTLTVVRDSVSECEG